MALWQVLAPTVEPVSLDEAKAHLVLHADDDDALIRTFIETARDYVETYTRRALVEQTWDLKLDSFGDDGESICNGTIYLPKPPVMSIVSITYIDNAGSSQPWTSYQSDIPTGPRAQRARIEPAYGQTYPTTRSVQNAVTVRFKAGYGTDSLSVPSSLKAAMLLLVGHWYANRDAAGAGLSETPLGVDALLTPYRVY